MGRNQLTRLSSRAGAAQSIRGVVEPVLLLLIVGLFVRTWLLEGLVLPLVIASGSMAPGLLGPHRDVVCGDCGLRFPCGLEWEPLDGRARCPNCRFADNRLGPRAVQNGDRVLLSRCIPWRRMPRRWEPVALRLPDRAGMVVVKRVVGLPGESIQIREGDVYVDGRIERKTLRQQRALAVLVHDTGHPATSDPTAAPGWLPERPESRWRREVGRFACTPAMAARGPDWLVYCHGRRPAAAEGPLREEPIQDDDPYDQGLPRREEEVAQVADLLISLQIERAVGQGRLLVRVHDGDRPWVLSIEPGGDTCRFEVRCGQERVGTPMSAPAVFPVRREVSTGDREFLGAADGRVVIARPMETRRPKEDMPSRPLAIGVEGLEVEIAELRVYRDVYYTTPAGYRARWGLATPVALGSDEFFVLGDNSPVSEDSRMWATGAAVRGCWIVGRPLVAWPGAIGAGHSHPLGRWPLHLPDLARVRYIH